MVSNILDAFREWDSRNAPTTAGPGNRSILDLEGRPAAPNQATIKPGAPRPLTAAPGPPAWGPPSQTCGLCAADNPAKRPCACPRTRTDRGTICAERTVAAQPMPSSAKAIRYRLVVSI